MSTDAPAPAQAKPKRSVPVYVPDGYVVRKQRAQDVEVEEAVAPQPVRRSRGGLALGLALGVVLGYAGGFAVARHAGVASVTVSVSGADGASPAASSPVPSAPVP